MNLPSAIENLTIQWEIQFFTFLNTDQNAPKKSNYNYIVLFKKSAFGSSFGLWEVLELKMPSRLLGCQVPLWKLWICEVHLCKLWGCDRLLCNLWCFQVIFCKLWGSEDLLWKLWICEVLLREISICEVLFCKMWGCQAIFCNLWGCQVFICTDMEKSRFL